MEVIAIKSVPCIISLTEIGVPFRLAYLISMRRLSLMAGNVSFNNCVRVIRSTLSAPFPWFFTAIIPDLGVVAISFSNTALADFTAGCCLSFHVHTKSNVPDSFSARRPIAIRAKAVDCVLNHSSCDRFFETTFACCKASRSRFIRISVSRIIASSRSEEP